MKARLVGLLLSLALLSLTPASAAPWLNEAIIYGTMPGRFNAVTALLPDIARLGATVVWLPPITAAAAGDFGYAVTDPFKLRKDLGTEQDFRTLLARAHSLGLRVMLDAVTNHLSDRSPYFRDSVRRGRRSPYYVWFQRNAGGAVVHYFDWTHLENLNYDNPEVRNFEIASLAHWVVRYPVDAFRLDAIWAMRERAPELLPRLRNELTRLNPGVALLAEASARELASDTKVFDAAYDWTSAAASVRPTHPSAPGSTHAAGGQPRTARCRPAAGRAGVCPRARDRRPLDCRLEFRGLSRPARRISFEKLLSLSWPADAPGSADVSASRHSGCCECVPPSHLQRGPSCCAAMS